MSYTGNLKIKGLTPGYSDNRFMGNYINSSTSLEAANATISNLTCSSGSITNMTIGTGVFGTLKTGKVVSGSTGGLYMGTYLFLNNVGNSVYIGENAGGYLASEAKYLFNNVIIGKNAFGGTISIPIVASDNVIIGYNSKPAISGNGSDKNTIIGSEAMTLADSSGNNTAIGYGTLTGLINGFDNIAIGAYAGRNYMGDEPANICIGNAGELGDFRTTRIGGAAFAGIDKCFIQGIRGKTTDNNNAVAVLIDSAGQLGTVSSSIRFKENIKSMKDIEDLHVNNNINNGSLLMDLNPVIFNLKSDKENCNGKKHTRYGLIAEEVEKVMKDLVSYDINEKGEEVVYSVKYHDLIPLLLHELQIQRKMIESKQTGKINNNSNSNNSSNNNSNSDRKVNELVSKIKELAKTDDSMNNKIKELHSSLSMSDTKITDLYNKLSTNQLNIDIDSKIIDVYNKLSEPKITKLLKDKDTIISELEKKINDMNKNFIKEIKKIKNALETLNKEIHKEP